MERDTPQATLDWQVTDTFFTYVTVAKGFKGGGFDDTPANVAQATTPFDPETATNYEIGIKTDFLDNRMRLNADVFYMDYKDLQVTQTNAASAEESAAVSQELSAQAEEASSVVKRLMDLVGTDARDIVAKSGERSRKAVARMPRSKPARPAAPAVAPTAAEQIPFEESTGTYGGF